MRKTFRLLVALLLASSLYSCTQYDNLPMGTRLRFLGGDYEFKDGAYFDSEPISNEFQAQVTLDVLGYTLTITDGLHYLVKDVFLDFGKFKGTIEDDGTKTYYIHLDRMYVCFTTDEETYIELSVETEEFNYIGVRGELEEEESILGVYLFDNDSGLFIHDGSIELTSQDEIESAPLSTFNDVFKFIVVSFNDVYKIDIYFMSETNYEYADSVYVPEDAIFDEKSTLYFDEECCVPIEDSLCYITVNKEESPITIDFKLVF